MALLDNWPRYQEAFVRLIYPSHCGSCGTFLELEEADLCSECGQRLESLRFSPEEAALDEPFEYIDEGWRLYPYESPVREIIAAIKFLKKRWLIRCFSQDIRHLIAMLTAENSYDALIPIPISRGTLVEREFNQTELIARQVSAVSAIPVSAHILQKKSHTPPQSQLTRKEREANLWGTFHVPPSLDLTGRTYLIIDDIITTGTTADEAARQLKNHGARKVDVLALASTPRHS